MNYCNEGGTTTEKYIAYHEERARGVPGMIITVDYAVDPLGCGFKKVAIQSILTNYNRIIDFP